jgi:quercetin dioxygenase-like cupin family protein
MLFAAAAGGQEPAGKSFADFPDGFEVVAPDDVPWEASPFPGTWIARLHGDQSEEGLYVVRAKFAPGAFSPPHYHDRDRYVTVISGTWWVGTGTEFDPANTVGLEQGGFMVHPAGGVHFDGARDEETVVEIRGYGPVATTLAEPAPN